MLPQICVSTVSELSRLSPPPHGLVFVLICFHLWDLIYTGIANQLNYTLLTPVKVDIKHDQEQQEAPEIQESEHLF